MNEIKYKKWLRHHYQKKSTDLKQKILDGLWMSILKQRNGNFSNIKKINIIKMTDEKLEISSR